MPSQETGSQAGKSPCSKTHSGRIWKLKKGLQRRGLLEGPGPKPSPCFHPADRLVVYPEILHLFIRLHSEDQAALAMSVIAMIVPTVY